jgi:perosamine synthetase
MINHSASHLLAADFEYVRGIVERNFIGKGPLCAELESLLATRFGRTEVTLTHSGTAALHLCLVALAEQNRNKTRVLLGAYVCPEVVSAVIQAGLEPAFADCLADSLNVDMAAMANGVDAKTLALICTNIGGVPDDYLAAAAMGVPVISDCAQSVGSRVAHHDVASEGICSILSFGATKMLTAGSGGALLTSSEELGRAVAHLARQELPVEHYRRAGFGVTFGQHMGDLTAGLALAQLRRLDALVARRRQIAQSYDGALSEQPDVHLVNDSGPVRSNRFRYYFLSEQAPAWVEYLRSLEIDARRSISHLVPEYFGNLKAFPNIAKMSERVVSIPIFPAMTAEQVGFVAKALAEGLKR